jgi:hypothetical protein
VITTLVISFVFWQTTGYVARHALKDAKKNQDKEAAVVAVIAGGLAVLSALVFLGTGLAWVVVEVNK